MDMDMGFAKKLANEIVKSDLVVDGKINPKGEKRFLQLYPYTNNNTSTTAPQAGGGNIVERDRSQSIQLSGTDIKQGGVIIGNYSSKQSTHMGNVQTTYSLYLPDGTKVAEGVVLLNETSGTFTTLKDNKQHKLNFSSTFKWDIAKEAAKYLAERYYM